LRWLTGFSGATPGCACELFGAGFDLTAASRKRPSVVEFEALFGRLMSPSRETPASGLRRKRDTAVTQVTRRATLALDRSSAWLMCPRAAKVAGSHRILILTELPPFTRP
jgi:hypothetical protein